MDVVEQFPFEPVDLKASIFMEDAMFGGFRTKRQQRKITRQDRQYLEARVRSFLNGYLAASNRDKDRYLEVVAAVAAACEPENVVSFAENLQVAELTAATAGTVVMRRVEKGRPNDRAYEFMTDACATVAIAYRRAAGIYVGDERMQKLGTAAVHLVTMATSRKMAASTWEQGTPEISTQDSDESAGEQSCNSG